MAKRLTLILLISLTNNKGYTQIMLFGEPLPIEKIQVENKLKSILDKLIRYGVTPEKLIAKAQVLFPYFESIAAQYGVPSDFKYLAVVESNLNNRAFSQVGAGGLWQIMPATARELGLVVNGRIDERLHIEKSTHSAMLYLKKNKKYFRSWTLTASSYNCGAGCILNNMKKSGSSDFYSITLNTETSEYIYKIIGVKLLFEEYFNKNKPIPSIPKNIDKKLDIPVEIRLDSVSSIKSDVSPLKKVWIKDLSIRTMNESTLTDSTGNISIKVYNEDNQRVIIAPYTIDKIDKRAYIRINGIDIDKQYQDYFAYVYDKDLGDGLNITDYQIRNKIIIPKNLKTKIKLYEYK